MRKMLKEMQTRLTNGEDLVLVTVTASSGAAPRGTGARMLVGSEGRICGTIGGGAVEYRSQLIATEVLKSKTSGERDFSLTREDVQNLGMICGGAVNVFFNYLSASDPEIITLTKEAEERFREGADLWLISDIAAGGKLSLADRHNTELAPHLIRHPHRVQEGGKDFYIEQIAFSERVFIFGGGHVAQEVEPVLSHVGFRCVVLEDRPEFAKPELFPTAEKVMLVDFNRIGEYVTIGSQDFVCIMTRGHASDTVIQAQVLPFRPAYVGVIGSRRKAAGVRQKLHDEYGLSNELLDQVTTPIGLDIQAETPAEIAISIAGQMIEVRARKNRLLP